VQQALGDEAVVGDASLFGQPVEVHDRTLAPQMVLGGVG
jgi:hypothetical protein